VVAYEIGLYSAWILEDALVVKDKAYEVLDAMSSLVPIAIDN
jgi:hypothetical protein